ncbi:hypothetical protein NKG95_13690 [Mesorhizobium sp. M1423]|uniref:hypothetical protein n=1 Tax=Mesorhizobium sp. M1423 TaxID=2957101 RepID=UPI00333910C9
MLDGLPERRLVFLAGPLSIRTTDPPVHTPTTTADGAVAEQVLERRPQIGRQCVKGELHVMFFTMKSQVRMMDAGGFGN